MGDHKNFYQNIFWKLPDIKSRDIREDPFGIELVNFLKRYDMSEEKFLEIGSGMGELQDVVADYTGIDVNSDLKRFYKKPFFLVGDGNSYPFPDETFGGIFTRAVFEHVPDIDMGLRETLRVLKPGGMILFNAAWQVRPWAANGYGVRPYSDLDLRGKLIKASIPLRDNIFFRLLFVIPGCMIRTGKFIFSKRFGEKLDNKKIKANYEKFWTPDSDACNHIDPHAMILWFMANGCRVLNYPNLGKAFFVKSGSLIVKKHD